MKNLEFTYCPHTGLIYANEVALAAEDITALQNAKEILAPLDGGQFGTSITITDKINETSTSFTMQDIEALEAYLDSKPGKVSSAANFNFR